MWVGGGLGCGRGELGGEFSASQLWFRGLMMWDLSRKS